MKKIDNTRKRKAMKLYTLDNLGSCEDVGWGGILANQEMP